ncbi:hypothetical protein SESBI_18501 [Sesbania bispinosa]|nr:hypothetical protein SESBI_18501 [Sesbania bispinosa]
MNDEGCWVALTMKDVGGTIMKCVECRWWRRVLGGGKGCRAVVEDVGQWQ